MVSSVSRARELLILLFSCAVILSSAGTASATPTAEFTFGPTAPAVAEPVSFHFTGSCDLPPCRISWRWFKPGGSSLGTSMGEGSDISYSFGLAGSYSVVVKITNSTSTHAFATATHVVIVHDTVPTPPTPPVPPSAPTGVAASILGATVTVTWRPPSSDGGAAVQRYEVLSDPPGDPTTGTVCDTAELTCQVAAGPGAPLQDGLTYTFTVLASNVAGSGPESAPSNPVTPDLSGPVVEMSGASWRTVFTGTSAVAWTGTDPAGVASYQVDRRFATAGQPYHAWTSSRQSTASTLLVPPVGGTVCVRVRGVDAVGNVGAFAGPTCRTSPVDDRSMSVRGAGARLTAAQYYRHTLTRVRGPKSRLVLEPVRAAAAQLVATTCRRCGSVRVFYGGHLVDVISLRSAATHHRQLFPLPTPSSASGITLRPASDRGIRIDGLSLLAR